MSVVSTAQFNLMRASKGLEAAYAEGDWDSVRKWDTELAEHLGGVCNDANKDTALLFKELEHVLATYARIVDELPEQSVNIAKEPKS